MSGNRLSAVVARGLVVWMIILAVETVHGIFRRILMEPVLGDLRARQISVLTGSIQIFIITMIFVRWLKATRAIDLVIVGAVWVVLTVAFEICLGRFVIGMTWDAIAADYDISRGGLMLFGLLAMLLAPLAAGKMLDEV
jgi:hypothetical protein